MKLDLRIWIPAAAGAATAAMVLSGCQSQDGPATAAAPAAASAEILVGEVGSMTGSEATFGQGMHKAVSLAFDQINAQGGIKGKKLKLISMDDQGKASEAALAATKLASSDHVRAIIGEVASSRSLAMAPIAQQNQVPMVTPSSLNSKVTQTGDYIFRVCFVDTFQSHVIEQFATKNLHAKKAAVLTDTASDNSVDSAKIFTAEFVKDGGEVVVNQSYSGGDMDFKSQLTAIKAKNPDVVIVPGYYTDIGLIARQAKEVGVTAPLVGGDAWDSPKLKEIGGAALDGSYFVSHFSQEDKSPLVQGFLESYKKAYGETPDGLAALGFDAARVVADALSRETDDTGPGLRTALAATKDFPGVTGKITIGPDRNAVKQAVVFKLSGGGNASIATVIGP
jgi:branched-chain amino acid transport system substrate-binding protein